MSYPLLAISRKPPASFKAICGKLDDLTCVQLAPGDDTISIRIMPHGFAEAGMAGWAEVERVLDVLAEHDFKVVDLHAGGRFSRAALKARLA